MPKSTWKFYTHFQQGHKLGSNLHKLGSNKFGLQFNPFVHNACISWALQELGVVSSSCKEVAVSLSKEEELYFSLFMFFWQGALHELFPFFGFFQQGTQSLFLCMFFGKELCTRALSLSLFTPCKESLFFWQVLRVCVFLSFCWRIRIYLFWDFWQALTKILQETFFFCKTWRELSSFVCPLQGF